MLLLRFLFIIVHMQIWDFMVFGVFGIPIFPPVGMLRGSLWLHWPEINKIESLELRL